MAAERWLEATWPVVQALLPAPPARVLELGCGPLGGFVPRLRDSGCDAVGVDPNAPEEAGYHRVRFEEAELSAGADALVASASLHHVADPAEVLDRVAAALAPGGTVVVVEWAWEDLDEPTAEWGFRRLGPEEGWLRRRREGWLESGQPWSAYFQGWAQEEGLHPAGTLLRLLDERFEHRELSRGPYLFADLAETSPEDEQRAIDAGEIRATRVVYAGRRA
ncbi:MAG TPA: class I SAM-dependent methyltransferase [Gaiellaceae bacterium]|nr:class I SAM-dependent methyltransferase [Gaiellaceae bacterium]